MDAKSGRHDKKNMRFDFPIKSKKTILAVGAESAGNFSVYKNGKIYFSENFGDLLEDKNFLRFKKAVLEYLKNNKIKPDIIITDLHPLYKTTIWGAELAKKYKIRYARVQHHVAHIFSAIGEWLMDNKSPLPPFVKGGFCGIAMDGTGYGLDGKIWGGEVFKITNYKLQITNKSQISKFKIAKQRLQIQRIGKLEDQIMIGGDLAVKEPARMLIAILAKIPNSKFQIPNKFKIKNLKLQKDFIYQFVKKFYTCNEFELLYNQLRENFNCVETSSTGRILDAVSVLLGFAGNERNYKHEAAELLEKNSTKPYELPPLIKGARGDFELQTTPLFEYLIKNLHKDKRHLAAAAQLYIARGLHEIIKKSKIKNQKSKMFFSGGLANNKIISSYLESSGAYKNKKVPRGDAGLSFGQIIYYLFQR